MDIIITELNEKHKALKLLESQMSQRRARLLTKQPGWLEGDVFVSMMDPAS